MIPIQNNCWKSAPFRVNKSFCPADDNNVFYYPVKMKWLIVLDMGILRRTFWVVDVEDSGVLRYWCFETQVFWNLNVWDDTMQQLHGTFILVRLWVLLSCNSNETAVGVARVRCEKRECTARLRLKVNKYLT